MNTNAFRTALVAGFMMLAAALPAHAGLINWNLNGVTFSDGTTASGSIVMDPTARTWSSFSVSTAAGTLAAFTFDTSNSGLYFGGGAGPNNFILMEKTGRRYFNFSFVDAMNPAGGSFALNTASSYECMNCNPFRRVTAGSLSSEAAAAVPEPATTALLLPALGLMGWISRRRTQQAAR